MDGCDALGFFRVLLPGFTTKLPIPRSFIEKIKGKEEIQSKATLVSPGGKEWLVDVHREGTGAALFLVGEGWKRFIDGHGLELGFFLTFSYKGGMMFEFKVYDLSTCERAYLSSTPVAEEEPVRVQQEENRDSISEQATRQARRKAQQEEVADSLSEPEAWQVKRRAPREEDVVIARRSEVANDTQEREEGPSDDARYNVQVETEEVRSKRKAPQEEDFVTARISEVADKTRRREDLSDEERSSKVAANTPKGKANPADEAMYSANVRAEEVRSKLGVEFPSFVKLMRRSHVSGSFWLHLPVCFSSKYLPKCNSMMNLVDEDGKQSQTGYLALKSVLSSGWRGFSKSHGLVDGDALVFQLIEPTTFSVYIVRAISCVSNGEPRARLSKREATLEEEYTAVRSSKVGSGTHKKQEDPSEAGRYQCDAQKKALEIQSNLDANFPSFVKQMSKAHVSGGYWFHLPTGFSRKHLPRCDSTITLVDEDGKQSETGYLAGASGLSAGWRGFSISHGLVNGDVLVFQLIKPTVFSVYIVRASGCKFNGGPAARNSKRTAPQPQQEDAFAAVRISKVGDGTQNRQDDPSEESRYRYHAEKKVMEIQSKLDDNFPSFVKQMSKAHVSGGYWFHLPTDFSRKHLPRRDSTITLVDEDGKQSETGYLAGASGLSAGWRGFSISHGLVNGDVLVFQLIKPTTFSVYIVRASGCE